jgi:hypothetical protein
VLYYSNSQPVEAVSVQIPCGAAGPTLTDATGAFTLPNVPSSQTCIEPFKVGDQGTAISALDAAWALQSTVQLRTLTALQAVACDVTGDGTVSALDSALILRFQVGLIDVFPVALRCGSDWAFAPSPGFAENLSARDVATTTTSCQRAQICYDPLVSPASNQDFLAIVYGDCTGNWSPSAPALGGSADAALLSDIRAGGLRRVGTGRWVLPIYVDRPRVMAVDIDVHYDPLRLRAVRARRLPAAAGALLASNTAEAGRVRIALAGTTPMGGSDRPLVAVSFIGEPRGHTIPRVGGHAYAGEEEIPPRQ